MNNQNFKLATMLALTTAVISGISNFLNKIAVAGAKDPIIFTTLKNSLVALAVLGILLGLKRWRELRQLNTKQILLLLAIGVVGGALPFALFFTGLAQTSAINASLIHKTLFLWVLLFAMPILKERLTPLQELGIAAIFLANILVGGFKGFQYDLGELLILGATFFWAIEQVIAKIALRALSAETVAAARMTIGSLILLPFAISRGANPTMLSAMSSVQWGWTMLTGLLLLGYVLTWYNALKRAPATYVATLLVPATLVTNALSAIFITHSFNAQLFLSSVLFIFGTALMVRFAKKPNLKLKFETFQ